MFEKVGRYGDNPFENLLSGQATTADSKLR